MLKKLLPIAALVLLSISCSLTTKTSTPEPVVIVVTATPQVIVPTDTLAPPPATPTAVRQVVTDTISEPVAATLTLLAGPFTDTLIRNDQYMVPEYCADVNVRDFAARVTFTSLPAFDVDKNSFALFFRQTGDDDQYRLIIYRYGWELYNVRGLIGDNVLVNTGQLDMTWNIHGDNTLEVYSAGNTGYFYLNGYRIFTLNLKDRDFSGDICVVSSVYNSDTYGVVTEFKDFEVWQLDLN